MEGSQPDRWTLHAHHAFNREVKVVAGEMPEWQSEFDVVRADVYDRLRAENERLRAFAFGDAPEWEKANCTLKHRVREVEAEIERLREAATLVVARCEEATRIIGLQDFRDVRLYDSELKFIKAALGGSQAKGSE